MYIYLQVLSEKGENQSASEVLERITILDPENKTVFVELKKERMRAKERTQGEKNLYQKMMGTKSSASPSKQKKAESGSRSKVRHFYPFLNFLVFTGSFYLHAFLKIFIQFRMLTGFLC